MFKNVVAIVLLFSSYSSILAQGESAFFEGSMNFEVEIKGPAAGDLLVNEPNNKMDMHLKDGNYIINLRGGRYPKSFMFIADSNRQYSMDVQNKTAFKYSSFNDLAKKQKAPVAVYSGKTEEVNGVMCDIYRARSGQSLMTYFVCDQYRVDLGQFGEKTTAKASFLVKGLEGRIPLKTVKKDKNLLVITTVTKIQARTFAEEQFMIPPDFEIGKRDYRY